MKSKKMGGLLTGAVSIAALLCPVTALAQIYESTFTDTNNVVVNIRPTAKFYNPRTPMALTLISGLDRYLTVTVKNKSGEQLFNQKSTLTTINDRITASDGTDFYGKKMTLPALSDDNYVITVLLTDLKDAQVATYTYNWTIDTHAPAGDPITADASTSAPVPKPGTVFKLGVASGDQFDFFSLNVSDESSGIAGAIFNIYNPDGSLFSSTPMKYDSAGKKVYHTYAYHTSEGVGMPSSNLDEEFQAEVQIKDNAGNINTLPKQPFRWDNVIGEITLFAVRDPLSNSSVVPGISSGYKAYQAGMTVNENPIRFVYRIPLTNLQPDAEGGLQFINRYETPKQLYRDATYAYIEMKIPYGSVNADMVRMRNFGSNYGYKPAFSVKLGPTAPVSPAIVRPYIEYRDEAGTWWPLADMQNVDSDRLPKIFDRVRYLVSPRPYDQIVNGLDTCTVLANQSSCEAVANYNMLPNTQANYRKLYTVSSADDSGLGTSGTQVVSWNDTQKPTVTNVSLDKSTNILSMSAFLPGDSEWLEEKMIVSWWLSDSKTGNKLTLSGTNTNRVSGNYTFTFPLSQLAEGSYNLVCNVADKFNNAAAKNYGPVVIDRTAPTAAITYEGKSIAGDVTVMGLENIRITLQDNLTQPRITRIQLSGGPTSDVVDLSWSSISSNVYGVEYPRVFPSLSGEGYTLKVTVQDEQNNSRIYTVGFKYMPANLVQLQNLRTLAVNSPLKTSTNAPLAFLRTSVLRKENGQIAKGVQNGTLTVRSDAAFPITMNGVTAAPGQTVNITINLGNGDETLVPIFPGQSGKAGDSSFMVEFPQLTD